MIERRYLTAEDSGPLELEERSGASPKIRGTAAVYNSPSRLLEGRYFEVIEPGAFDHLIDQRRSSAAEVVALFNHDASQLLGRTSAKTLRLWSDDRGLHYEIDPVPNTTLGRDLLEHLRLGNIRGSSFAFTVAPEDERTEQGKDGRVTRYIKRASGLFDVSPVTTPAYDATAVNVRCFEAFEAAPAPAAPAPEPQPLTPRDRLNAARARAMLQRAARIIGAVLLMLAVCSDAYAIGRRRGRSQGSYSSAPAGGDTSTAQGVAEIQARLGRVGHFGGNSGYEGCGSGPTPEAALRNCCYSNSGMAVVDQGTAQGRNGQWYACKRFGR
jgi:HK97 family phage prohead protease